MGTAYTSPAPGLPEPRVTTTRFPRGRGVQLKDMSGVRGPLAPNGLCKLGGLSMPYGLRNGD